jgi:glutathione S-transferase
VILGWGLGPEGKSMKAMITVFEDSPDEGQGLARDMRVRWALEEVGQPYDVRLVSMKGLKEPGHRARNPFGSIPTYEEGDLTLFESGAIVFHIAERHTGLLPADPAARARAVMWMFAALNTVEPPIVQHEMATHFEKDKSWRGEHLAMIEKEVRGRLADLSNRLGDAEWLDGEFSAGDLMMVLVLRRLDGSGIVKDYSNLAAYVARGEARPAYKRAFRDQAYVFTAASGKKPKPVQR